MVFVSKTTPGGRNWVPPTLQQPLVPSPPMSSGGEPPFLCTPCAKDLRNRPYCRVEDTWGYPLVNIQKAMERSTQSPIYSWEKPLFRLGHFPRRFLYVYQGVSRHRSLGPFNQIAVHRSRGPRKTPKRGCKTSPASSVVDVPTWWFIPLSKWVITPVINGISRVNPLITGVITHLLSGMSHQVSQNYRVPIIRYTQDPVARGNFPTISKGQFKWACVISHFRIIWSNYCS